MKPQIKAYKPGGEYWFPEGCYIDELLNDPNDPVVSIARARVPVGGITRWHRLRGTAERYLIESGRGRVELGVLDSREVGPGDVVVIPPDCRQRIANLANLYYVPFAPHMVASFLGAMASCHVCASVPNFMIGTPQSEVVTEMTVRAAASALPISSTISP
mgnify:CR=1 FL=1